MRAAILSLLAQAPANGYALIQAITEHTDGSWKPSPGSVYPTLAQLVDEGLITPVDNLAPRSDYQPLIDQARGWGETLASHTILPTPDGILAPATYLTDFQEDFVTARQSVLNLRGAAKKIATLK